MTLDVAIIGGGPAGLATAIGAALQGLSVHVFEKQNGPIDKACGLKSVLRQAQAAFLRELDQHTLAEFVPRAPALMRLWRRPPEARPTG